MRKAGLYANILAKQERIKSGSGARVANETGNYNQGLDIGASIDTTRPILDNPDGSFSTERTITIESNGKYFNIPTIVGGQQQSQEDAIRLWRSGNNKEVGSFNTLEDAVSTAERRSSEIGKVRGNGR